jgi:hypothetical protein
MVQALDGIELGRAVAGAILRVASLAVSVPGGRLALTTAGKMPALLLCRCVSVSVVKNAGSRLLVAQALHRIELRGAGGRNCAKKHAHKGGDPKRYHR